ncbi:MAG TPA: AMP-binding protein, partial [Polyangiaceae bacterium]|nr:AMP-binding protein [Polyangiaceae bacterium]
MDVTPYLEPRIAPRVIFDALPVRGGEPRFMVPAAQGWHRVTWAAFAADIRRIALYLRALGLRPGDTVAIFAQNRVEWMAAAMGIQAAGCVMVPIYPASTPAQATYVLEHSEARVLFVDTRERAALFHERSVEHIVLLGDEHDDRAVAWSRAAADGELDLDAVDLDQPALMLYTSGTTGDPKGVPLTHRNIAENWRDWLVCNASLLDEGATDLLWLPFSHIFGFGEACLGNTLGFTSYLSDPKQVLEHMPEVKPTVFMSVPAYWEKIAAAAASPDPQARRENLRRLTGGRLRFCLSGGAGLKREVKELFHECGVLIIEGYGLTECSPTLTLNRPESFRFDSVGKPLPSVELKLADDGEILARGPNIFSGYHKNPQATREAFT